LFYILFCVDNVLFYVFFVCVVLCIVCVYVLLPPGVNPIAVKYIISYHIISYHIINNLVIYLDASRSLLNCVCCANHKETSANEMFTP